MFDKINNRIRLPQIEERKNSKPTHTCLLKVKNSAFSEKYECGASLSSSYLHVLLIHVVNKKTKSFDTEFIMNFLSMMTCQSVYYHIHTAVLINMRSKSICAD